MRVPCGIVAVLTTLLASHSASAQTPTADHLHQRYGHILMASACATDEFVVRFDAGTSEVSDSARAQFQADLVHPRSCNLEVAYLAAYDMGALSAVRELLIAEGVRADAIHAIQLVVPIAPWPYDVEDVRVTFIYR